MNLQNQNRSIKTVLGVVRVVRAMRFTHTPLHCKVTGVEKRSSSTSTTSSSSRHGSTCSSNSCSRNDNCNSNSNSKNNTDSKAGRLENYALPQTPMPKASLQNRQNLVCLCPSQLGAVVVVVVVVAVAVVLVAVVAVVVAIAFIDCSCQIMRKTKGVFRTGCH